MSFGSLASSSGAEWIGKPTHEPLARGSKPTLPSQDPFHQPPPGYEHARPGTVLRSRDVELAFLGLIPQRFSATQLLYRTTDMNGEPDATVTTVISPGERTADKPCPVLSYQCAIDAVTSRCFPSYTLRRRAKAIGALSQFELLLIAAALAEGWVVSVPDHEGSKGIWGAPYGPGYCVLDGVRAAVNHTPLALDPAAPVGLWGYSGGGLASAWAAEMYAGYAPELNLVGAALGSPVGDLGHTYRRLNGGFYSGLPTMVVAGLTQIYPDLNRVIEEHATPKGKKTLARAREMTTIQAILRLIKMDMGTMVDRPLDEILDTPEVRYVFDNIKLGTSAPVPPVLIVQSVHDRIVAVEDIDELARTYSAGGSHVTYHRDTFSEHLLLHTMSAPMTLRWLRDRFTGRPLTDHQVRTTWPTIFNPSTYRGMLRLAVITAKVLAGRRLERQPLSRLDC